MSTLTIPLALPSRRTLHAVRRVTLRIARRASIALGVVAALAAFTLGAGAQTFTPPSRLELRPLVGGFVPTGDQRDVLDDAGLLGAQVGYRLHRHWVLVGSFGWAQTTDKGATSSANTVDAYQYDLGVEARLPDAWRAGDRTPLALGFFAGAGLGARSYDYVDRAVSAETNLAGYGAAGVDIGPSEGLYSLRLEARDYVSSFRGLRGELPERTARNDLALYVGVGFRF